MTVVKSKEIVFRVPVFFREKKKTEHFSKYINFKIEMNPCSGKTAKLKDLFLIERDTVALMPSYINLNFLTSFEV